VEILHLGHRGKGTLYWRSQWAAGLPGPWTFFKLASCLDGTFLSSLPAAFSGGRLSRGAGTYVLGVFLHFFIACSAAAVYYIASRRLVFMKEHPLVCGLFFGAAVQEVMNLVVLPLSALQSRGPYKLHDLILGLLVHMVVIGLPISFSVRRFAK
jgi:Na+/alanine symporter